MKTAKSYKILTLIVAFVLSVTAFFLSFGFNSHVVKAESTLASSYVSGSFNSAEFKNNALVVKVADGNNLKFKNDFVVDDFAIELGEISQKINQLTFNVTAKSYISTGNKNSNGEFDTNIVNKLILTRNEASWNIKVNDNSVSENAINDGEITISINVIDNFFKFSVNSWDFTETNSYYKVKTVDKTVATDMEFVFGVEESETPDFSIKSIDQKVSDGEHKYKQNFECDNTTNIERAYPMVVIDENFFTNTGNAYELKKYNGTKYTVSMNAYSFFGNVTSSSLYLVKGEIPSDCNIWLASMDKPTSIQFNGVGEFSFKVVSKVNAEETAYEEYFVDVFNSSADTTAPKYYDLDKDSEAYESFIASLKKQYFVEAEGDVPAHSVVLGNSISIPDMSSLVYDDFTGYSSLKKTVYYTAPTTANSGNTSSLSFTLKEAGNYVFYVVFTDESNNAMEKEDFVTTEDGKDIISDEEMYHNFVFSFHVDDDAPIILTVVDSQGEGFIGTKYKSSAFDIDASGFNIDYKLYYNSNVNANEDSDDWVEIEKSNKEVNYDGELTFTPNKKGAYKITCTVSSKASATRAVSKSTIIKVQKSKTVVYPYENWFKDHITSVIFLGIGVLCLIGIVVLLFIKPKEAVEEEEDTSSK